MAWLRLCARLFAKLGDTTSVRIFTGRILELVAESICAGAIFSLFAGPALAREVVSQDAEFRIAHDFSKTLLPDIDTKTAILFFDARGPFIDGASSESNLQLRKIVSDAMATRIHFTHSKENATHLLQIRMEERTDRAIQSPSGAPSVGLVMLSVCELPIQSNSVDCENLQYDFFRNRAKDDVLRSVMERWLALIPTR